MPTYPMAVLALEDGSVWLGRSFGAEGSVQGEIVFNTSLSGYQEILTDPSYHGQLVTMTMPHIGNYGVTPEDDESDRVWATALLVRQVSPVVSNWRARQSLPDYLRERGVIALTDVDTRALVRHIRDNGAMRAAIVTGSTDGEAAVALAKSGRDMNGLDLAREVSCEAPYEWTEGFDWWRPEDGGATAAVDNPYRVVAYDFGIKRNILRLLASRGCHITVVPATTAAEEVLAMEPEGIFLSNGPGDPAAATYAIEATRQFLGKKPVFGICLGHQILGLALGGETYKLKFGHRGGNQPVQLQDSGHVHISSHNHGFALDPTSLPQGVAVSHVNLNDQCCEGLDAPGYEAFSVQYHPESAPGPHDSDALFDKFVDLMAARR
ncbi:MAG TPA: glutamine-hydrolyzing carbamoyl-phosphate synthase small subunit [Anaerolineae bacterium]|nr:glutamine-hydrolyzing carbamoyl-phosphate synthase small subunit [Anaerolineae bacterium]